MFTPQQIEQISFGTQPFGGYKIQEVDEFLEPLTEDYITLYKENALLKSKMRVLVSKLEEYRRNEASMRDAIVNAQMTCDRMIKEAEARVTQMMTEANAAVAENARNADALIAAENARVEEARRVASAKIAEIQEQMQVCIQALERIREAHAPAAVAPVAGVKTDNTDAVAMEISQNVEAIVGTADAPRPKVPPKHPTSETTGKFANLKFGTNYDPQNPNGTSDT